MFELLKMNINQKEHLTAFDNLMPSDDTQPKMLDGVGSQDTDGIKLTEEKIEEASSDQKNIVYQKDEKLQNKDVIMSRLGQCEFQISYLQSIECAEEFIQLRQTGNFKIIDEKIIKNEGTPAQNEVKVVTELEQTEMVNLELGLISQWFLFCQKQQHKGMNNAWFAISPEHRQKCYKLPNTSGTLTIPCLEIKGGSLLQPGLFVEHWGITKSEGNNLCTILDFNIQKQISIHLGDENNFDAMNIPIASINGPVVLKIIEDKCFMLITFVHNPFLVRYTNCALPKEDQQRLTEFNHVSNDLLGPTNTICIIFVQKNVVNESKDVIKEKTYNMRTVKIYSREDPQEKSNSLFLNRNIHFIDKQRENLGKTTLKDDRLDCTDDIEKQTEFKKDTLLWKLICGIKKRGLNIVYVNFDLQKGMEKAEYHLQNFTFEQKYAFRCLLSNGYKVSELIHHFGIDVFQEANPSAQELYHLSQQFEKKQIFDLQKELINSMSCNLKKEEVKSKWYVLIKRVVITPTTIVFLSPELVKQNRMMREHESSKFLRVLFRDEDFNRLTPVSAKLNKVVERIIKIMNKGILIADRKYKFLGCSNSQLREHGVWFYDGDAEKMRNSVGDLKNIRSVANYVTSLALCFSSSNQTVELSEGQFTEIEDVQSNGYCFTDGIGKISIPLINEIKEIIGSSRTPSAYQIRFAGYKGMVSQDPLLGDKIMFCVRGSMKKFESSSRTIEVLQYTKPRKLFLNRQVITLLSNMGIKDSVFLKMQQDMMLSVADIMHNYTKAFVSLTEVSLPLNLKKLRSAGAINLCDPFFKSVLNVIYTSKMKRLTRKSKVEINSSKGRMLIGTVDETGILKYGQVFIAYSDYFELDKITYLEREIICAKNPCFHPGDVRKFKAVNVTELHHMIDCIVFPKQGQRPHPDEMSGSDLDGDMYFVCWDDNLIPCGNNEEAMEYPKAPMNILDHPVLSSDITDFIGKYIVMDQLGVIANAHVVFADLEGVSSKECLQLAKIHAEAVDFPKTGKFTPLNKMLRPTKYPDFMCKSDKPSYHSSKILGQMFRQCQLIGSQVTTNINESTMEIYIDEDLIYPGYEKYLSEASDKFKLYCARIKQVMDLYGIQDEAEIISGIVLTFKKKRGYLRNEKLEKGEIVKHTLQSIWQLYRADFFQEFGGEFIAMSEEKSPLVFAKASAWYVVAYKDIKSMIYSFPWILSDILCSIKLSKGMQDEQISKVKISVANKISKSIHAYGERTEEKRIEVFNELNEFLKEIKEKIKHGLQTSEDIPTKLRESEVKPCGFFSIGIVFIQEDKITINMANIFDKYKPMKKFLRKVFKNKKLIDGDKILSDNEKLIVQFTLTYDDTKIVEELKYILSENEVLFRVFMLLYDWIMYEHLVDKSLKIIDFLFLLLEALKAVKVSNEDEGLNQQQSMKASDMLFSFLKALIENLKSEKVYTVNEKRTFTLKEHFVNEFKSKLIVIYTDIGKYHSVDEILGGVVFSKDYLYISLPLEIWSCISYAEVFTAQHLQQETGAEVSLRRAIYRGSPNLILEAFGEGDQINALKKVIRRLEDNADMFVNSKARDITFVAEALKCIFCEADSEKSQIILSEYKGKVNFEHKEKCCFVPKVIDKNPDSKYPVQTFIDIFKHQFSCICSTYEPSVHGKLRFTITFGCFYVYNCDNLKTINIDSFEKLLKGTGSIQERQRSVYTRNKQKRMKKSEYKKLAPQIKKSFVPQESESALHLLKKLHFEEEGSESKYNISINLLDEETGQKWSATAVMNKQMVLLEIRFSDLKWMSADLLTGFNNIGEKRMDVRVKLHSRRVVDAKSAKSLKDLSLFLDSYEQILTESQHGDLYVNKNCQHMINIVRFKETKMYKYKGADADSFWHDIEIHISTVKEYSALDRINHRFTATRTTRELTILPKLPDLQATEAELEEFSENVWDILKTINQSF